ncbi:hypothetical protein CRG98_009555 [Punica granatum]|uniref:DUF4218 domain-containing protein n=1 Tax=Punica granatum TaxID=22663 RepID=A0A2I0KNN7_PUNGR|nr:hypothetical protein CRG98_009555 [Punica granatum]
MCSRLGPHALDRIALLGSVHLPGGCVSDMREKESPLPVYDLKVEGQKKVVNFRVGLKEDELPPPKASGQQIFDWIEKNLFDNIFNTVMDIKDKTKNNVNVWKDFEDLCYRLELHLISRPDRKLNVEGKLSFGISKAIIKAYVEGPICEAYLSRETTNFCSYYFEEDVHTQRKRVHRNDDGGASSTTPPIWTRMCSRQGPHACDRIARLGSVHLPGDA